MKYKIETLQTINQKPEYANKCLTFESDRYLDGIDLLLGERVTCALTGMYENP